MRSAPSGTGARADHRLPAADRERYHRLLAEYETTHRALTRLTSAA